MCISLCACGGTESTNANIQTESNNGTNTNSNTEKEVENTVDNWQEYSIKYHYKRWKDEKKRE